MATSEIPDWVTCPEEGWVTITPAEAGLDVGKFNIGAGLRFYFWE